MRILKESKPSDFIMRGDVLQEYVGTNTDVVIPDGVRVIWEKAFAKSKIKSVDVPSTVYKIGPEAFAGCEQLTTVVLREGLQYIGGNAFDNCSKLTDLVIPDSVEQIGYEAFLFTPLLVEDDGGLYVDNWLCDFEWKKNPALIKPSTIGIAEKAIDELLEAEWLVIPEGVKHLSEYAITKCNALKWIYIPNSVENFSAWCINECSNLDFILTPNQDIVDKATAAEMYNAKKGTLWDTDFFDTEED